MKFQSDIDIDFADRSQILSRIRHIPASINNESTTQAHNTGIYVTSIPVDPMNGRSSIDYKQAEDRGYIKLDLLNVNLYKQVKSSQHLDELLKQTPEWHRLLDRSFCEQVIHIGNHYDTLLAMPEPVDSIPRLAMFLAVIRPSKRYLIGRKWHEIAAQVWLKPDDGYYFKKSHSIAYAHLVVVNINLLTNLLN